MNEGTIRGIVMYLLGLVVGYMNGRKYRRDNR